MLAPVALLRAEKSTTANECDPEPAWKIVGCDDVDPTLKVPLVNLFALHFHSTNADADALPIVKNVDAAGVGDAPKCRSPVWL
jgi:hypothetical protein